MPGFEPWYRISDEGQVVRLARVSTAGPRPKALPEASIKVTRVVRDGKIEAATVTLLHPILEQTFQLPLTRLVLITFRGEPVDPAMIAITRDGNPENARLANLRWGRFADLANQDGSPWIERCHPAVHVQVALGT